MSIGVVVITARRDEHLRRVLHGLERQTRPADRVVVVDMDRSALRERPTSLPLTWAPLDPGGAALPLGAARNTGAAVTGCTDIAFLDVDCIPGPGFVADVAVTLAAHPGVLVCGHVRYLPEGWTDLWPAQDLDVLGAPHPARPLPADDHLAHEGYELFWSLAFGVAAPTWATLGGFDEGYCGYGAEDTDLAYRARRLGVPLLWTRGARAYHQWHPPSRLDPARTVEIVANARRFHERWGEWPMRGWLEELAASSAVEFDADAGRLEVTR